MRIFLRKSLSALESENKILMQAEILGQIDKQTDKEGMIEMKNLAEIDESMNERISVKMFFNLCHG